MKYTRYDIKKRKNNNFIFGAILFSTLIFALIIGTLVSNILFKNSTLNELPLKEPNNAVKVSNEQSTQPAKKTLKYVAVQGGVYKNAAGAESVKNTFAEYGTPFTVEDEKGTRVLLGIYSEENAVSIMKVLSDKNIQSARVSFDVNINDNCNSTITAIISGELEILSKFSDKAIKSIPTEQFKKWMTSLEEVSKESKNYATLTELKNHVNSLPGELIKEKASESYKYIYGILKKLV